MRPVVAAADHILDIHSTRRTWCRSGSIRRSSAMPPSRWRSAARRAPGDADRAGLGHAADPARPPRRQPATGARWWSSAASTSCGPAAELATDVSLDFLGHFGLIDAEAGQRRNRSGASSCCSTHGQDPGLPASPARWSASRLSRRASWSPPTASDEIRCAVDDCTIFMPHAQPIVGREACLPDAADALRDRGARLGSGGPSIDPSKICKVKRPLRLPLTRDATCRQGIASPQCLDDVCAMATR